MKNRFTKRLATTLALTASALLALPAWAQAKPPLKIGAYLSVTGPASYLGEGAMKTVEMYVDMINAGGGIDGRKIELISTTMTNPARHVRTRSSSACSTTMACR